MWSALVMLESHPTPARVAAPRLPAPSAPFHFPVIATTAPLVGSLVLFAVTQSPFTLVFAALGPVIAVASFADSRLGGRRTARREAARFERDLDATAADITRRHDAERAGRRESTPGATAILTRTGADPYRWLADGAGAVPVSLGSGEIPSGLELDHAAERSDALRDRLDALAAVASTLADAPVTVDARLGLGFIGARPLAEAAMRSAIVQLAWSLRPSEWWVTVTGLDRETEWLAALPHERRPGSGTVDRIEFGRRDHDDVRITVALAAGRAQLPAACRVIAEYGGGPGRSAIVAHPDRAERRPFRAEVVSRLEVLAWAPVLASAAAHEGLVGLAGALPSTVALDSLPGPSAEQTRGLAARFAVGAAGPVEVDLVEHGPHAIVGGTTGSGKSELLVSWVVAMAARHPPDRVSFLLVDFKGGSAFAAARGTAAHGRRHHRPRRARRAASAREPARRTPLPRAGARRSTGCATSTTCRALAGALPRLVIVVDEFAAMLADHPDLHALFADLAARGRSLGIHLVLCTQRPAGVVRDAVLANTDLRISLRVNNRADSSAVIGTDAAASIPAAARGRALLSLAGEPPRADPGRAGNRG